MVNFYKQQVKALKRIAFVLSLCFLQSQVVFGVGPTIIPAGAPSGSAPANYHPIGAYYGYQTAQMLYLGSEITGLTSGNSYLVDQVSFYLSQLQTNHAILIPIKIYMKQSTGYTSLPNVQYQNRLTGYTLVYSGNFDQTGSITTGWNSITLQTPFIYTFNAANNIEILIESSYGSDGYYDNVNFQFPEFDKKWSRTTTASDSRMQTWIRDYAPPTPTTTGTLSTNRADVQLNFAVPLSCSGAPAGPLKTLSSTPIACASTPFDLVDSGLFVSPTYYIGYQTQWQYSTVGAGGPWINYGAPVNNSPTTTVQETVNCWWRALVSCGAPGPQTASTPVSVPVQLCYCIPTVSSTFDTDIGQVDFGSGGSGNAFPGAYGTVPAWQNTGCSGTYTDNTGSAWNCAYSYKKGQTYDIKVNQITSGTTFYAAYCNVFIDWNNDGQFTPNERAFSGGLTGTPGVYGTTSPLKTFVNGTITIPWYAVTGTVRMRVMLKELGDDSDDPCGAYTWGEVEDYSICISNPVTSCNLSNAGVATATDTLICAGKTTRLNLSGELTAGGGLTYNWQISTNSGATWTDVPGANYYFYTVTGPLAVSPSWYRCKVTCATGPVTLYSNVLHLYNNTLCYTCIDPLQGAPCSDGPTITNVTLVGNTKTINNNTTCANTNGTAYVVYPPVVGATCDLQPGSSYTINITSANGNFYNTGYYSLWIDYDRNGSFDSYEWTDLGRNVGAGPHAVSFTVPAGAGTGLTGMRIRSRGVTPNGSPDACLEFFSGETEDYTITLLPPPAVACSLIPSFTPAAFPITANPTSPVCSGTRVNFTMPNTATNYTGLTYQWYTSNTSAAGPWTPVAGATSSAFAITLTASTWVQCSITCGVTTIFAAPASGLTVTSNTWMGINSDWSDPQNWCGRVPTTADNVAIDKTAALALPYRPAGTYFTPVVGAGDTLRANNLTIATLTDSLTILTEQTALVNVAQSINNSGKVAILSNLADTVSISSWPVSGLVNGGTFNQIFRGSQPDAIYQIIYTATELKAAGLKKGDVIDSLLFQINTYNSLNAYENFKISYGLIPEALDAFSTNDPITGLTDVYGPAKLKVTSPTDFGAPGKWTPNTLIGPKFGYLRLPTAYMTMPNQFVWTYDTCNIVLQFCFNSSTATTPGGLDYMWTYPTTGRRSTMFIASTNFATDGCALTPLSLNLVSQFGSSPSMNRPIVTFRFKRPQTRLSASVGADVNNLTANATIWSSFATVGITGSVNNSGKAYLNDSTIFNVATNVNNNAGGVFNINDTAMVRVSGDYVNNGTTNYSTNGISGYTGTLNIASLNVPVSPNIYGIAVGMTVTGPNIPVGTVVTAIPPVSAANSINISQWPLLSGSFALTFNYAGKQPTMDFKGTNYTNNSVINPGGGRISFKSSNAQVINGSNNSPFNDLNIEKTSDQYYITMQKPISIADSLVFRYGQLRMNKNFLFVNNSKPWAISRARSSSTATANGTAAAGNHSVTLASLSGTPQIGDVVVAASGITLDPPTYILNIPTATTITLSSPTTAALASTALTFYHTNGLLISEDSTSKVKWYVSTVNGSRYIPFGNAASATPVHIPFMMNLTNGLAVDTVGVSTYKAPANSPLPPQVHYLSAATAASFTSFGASSVSYSNLSTTMTTTTIPSTLKVGDQITGPAGDFTLSPPTYVLGYSLVGPPYSITLSQAPLATKSNQTLSVYRIPTAANDSNYVADRFWLLTKTSALAATPIMNFGFSVSFDERPCQYSFAPYTCASLNALASGQNYPKAYPFQAQSPFFRWITAPGGTVPANSYSISNAVGSNTSTIHSGFTWNIGNYNPWTMGTQQQPLPVELLRFGAQLKGDDVYIDWSTSSEKENNYFTVQRSLDLVHITDVARVPGSGNSVDLRNYDCWDMDPVKGKVNYYRLLQTDYDGTTAIASDFVPVRVGLDSKFNILYVRNEGSTDVIFDYDSNEPLAYEVTDMAGKVVVQGLLTDIVDGTNMLRMDNALFAEGMYLIRLSNTQKTVTHKFAFTR